MCEKQYFLPTILLGLAVEKIQTEFPDRDYVIESASPALQHGSFIVADADVIEKITLHLDTYIGPIVEKLECNKKKSDGS